MVLETDAAGVGRLRLRQNRQQGSLAGPIGPDNAQSLALANAEAHPIEHHKRAEALVEPVGNEDRRCGLHGVGSGVPFSVMRYTAEASPRWEHSDRARCRRSPDRTDTCSRLSTSPIALQ